MHHLSTSNSRTLESFPVPTRSFWGVAVILAAVRIIFLFNPDPLYPLATQSNEIFSTTWEQLYRSSMNEPSILIVGSSRIQRIPPSQLARNLKIDANDVSNLSRPANTFFDIHTFITRNPDVLKKCDLIIIDLLPMQLHKNNYFTQKDAAFFRNATLEDKLRIKGIRPRLFALGDTIFPFHSLRYRIDEWRMGFLFTREQKLAYNKDQLTDAVSFLTNEPGERGGNRKIHRVLNTEFPRADHLDVQAHALHEIVEAVSDRTNILLIRPPYRADIANLINTVPQYRESNRQFREFIESIDQENVHTVWMESPEAYNLTDDDYNDDGAHLSTTGLKKLTDLLSVIIQERGLLQP